MKNNFTEIPDKIAAQVIEISQYAGDCEDWVKIKKEILKSIPSSLRSLFSRRDPITKEQRPNNFDKLVIEYYKEITGIELKIIPLDKRKELNC